MPMWIIVLAAAFVLIIAWLSFRAVDGFCDHPEVPGLH